MKFYDIVPPLLFKICCIFQGIIHMNEKDPLQKEIQLMSEMNTLRGSVARIKLDIGGQVYTTSTLTLNKDPHSRLAEMFSGRGDRFHKEEDGSYFFDRDGTHFRYILNYLRDGGLEVDMLPGATRTELLVEAKYYRLNGLVSLLD